MGLTIQLRPGEPLYLGTSRVINRSKERIDIEIEGAIPILRDKDYLQHNAATSAASHLYWAVQQLYLEHAPERRCDEYSFYLETCKQQYPHATDILSALIAEVDARKYYRALKEAKHLIEYEKALSAQITK